MQKESGFKSILKERINQVVKHKFSLEKDANYKSGQLLKASRFCITLNNSDWPHLWRKDIRDHIKTHSLDDRIVIAGAFMAAEVDRLRGISQWEFERDAEQIAGNQKLDKWVKEEESKIHIHYSGDLHERVIQIVNYYTRDAALAIAGKKELIENVRVYMQSMVLMAETVGMAQTHGEKAARLRGMIELLNNTITKLTSDQEDSMFENWRYDGFSRSEFPYRKILNDYQQIKAENQDLKKQIENITSVPAAINV